MNNPYVGLALSVLEKVDSSMFFGSMSPVSIIMGAPADKQMDIIKAFGILYPNLNITSKTATLVYESYPKVAANIAAKLMLNIPVGQELTKKERHLWLSEGANVDQIAWVLRDTGLEARSMMVARWLLKVLNNPEQKELLYRTTRDGRLADHTIDLIPSDCQHGVREAIARREDRMAVEEFGKEKLCEPPPWVRRLGGRVKVLTTATALASEGRQMAHCVGGYASQVKSGNSIIVSIRAWGHRATVEYSRNKKLVQIKGKANSEASSLCKRLAELAIKKSKYQKNKNRNRD